MKTGVTMLKIQLCITGTNYILEIDYLNFNNISHFYLFLLCFVQIYAALVNIREDFFHKHLKKKNICIYYNSTKTKIYQHRQQRIEKIHKETTTTINIFNDIYSCAY